MRTIQMKKLYPMMIAGDGIFNDLYDYAVPWKQYIDSGLINQTTLDVGYYSHSANKWVSPFILDLIGYDDSDYPVTWNDLTTEQRTIIAGVVFNIYNRKWEHLWNINVVTYNPIHNYDMTEEETISNTTEANTTNTGTITNVLDKETTNTGTVTDVIDSDGTQTGTVANVGNSDTENGVFGFNSSVAVGSDTSEESVSNTRTDNLASTNDTTDTRTDNLASTEDATDTETRNLSGSEERTYTSERSSNRAGNIGVTTTQKLIESELDVWNWSFFKTVFEDIDSICCLDIY